MKQTKTTKKEPAAVGKETQTADASSRPAILLDYQKYAHFLEDSDLTEDQKQEFLQTLWNIIVDFVSLGFGVHPVQEARNTCGKLEEKPTKPALARQGGLNCSHSVLKDQFVSAADLGTNSAAKGAK